MSIIVFVYNLQAQEMFSFSLDAKILDVYIDRDKFGIDRTYHIKFKINEDGSLFVIEEETDAYFCAVSENKYCEGKICLEELMTFSTKSGEKLSVRYYIPQSDNIKLYSLANKQLVSLGSNVANDICFLEGRDKHINSQIIIERARNEALLKVKNAEECYVNKKRINSLQIVKLNYLDVIVADGIFVLFMNNSIGVWVLSKRIEKVISKLNKIENIKEIYCDINCVKKDVFKPVPICYEKPDTTPIELDAPPMKREVTDQPLLLTIGSSFVMAIPMCLGCVLYIIAARKNNSASGTFMYTGLITALGSAILGGLLAFLNYKNNKKKTLEYENKRKQAYKRYINRMNGVINERSRYNSSLLRKQALSVEECFCSNVNPRVWRERPGFLSTKLRLGLGNIPFALEINVPTEKFQIEDDELEKFPVKLKRKYRYLKDVPICIDLSKSKNIGFVSQNNSELNDMFLNVCLMLATLYSKQNAIFILFNWNNSFSGKNLEIVKWLPQFNSSEEHFVCFDKERSEEILCKLSVIFNENRYGKKNVFFFSDRNFKLPNDVEKSITKFLFHNNFKDLPGNVDVIVQSDEEFKGVIDVASGNVRTEINFDRIPFPKLEQYVRILAGLSVLGEETYSSIPNKITLPKLFEVDDIDSEYIRRNWEKNDTIDSLIAPIGIGENSGIVYLDAHEKAHGPHGLIAGMTGSGKSELLQTYILSMAIRYSPNEVSFFLIDYKGGGMANLFRKLPHLVGSISNLSGNMIYRGMVSIRGENVRRQKLFLEAKVNSIKEYKKKYISGIVSEPLPHMFIIIDEFAELKREQPEFMKELISVAQVGRSLGVHLILATQKPSGTVDENIFSNSRFRIALRVQSKQDSSDMLHRHDAAYISNPGRAFLQVGNDEIFEEFQSAYTMEPYLDNCSEKKYYLLDKYHRRLEIDVKNDCIVENEVITHFTHIMDKLCYVDEHIGEYAVPKLWLKPLDKEVVLDEAVLSEKLELYEIIVGIYDDPKRQFQGKYVLNLIKGGHVAVVGMAASGKSTFLQTYIYSYIARETPKTLNIYIIDYSNRLLSVFKNSRMVGAYITEEDSDDLCGNLFAMLQRIMKERKKEFLGISFEHRVTGNISNEPAILIVIDNFGEFRDKTGGRFDDLILELFKFGENYGIFFAISGNGVGQNDIPMKIFDNCKNVVALRLNDKYHYSECLRTVHLPVLPDTNVKGRGIALIKEEILELQTGIMYRTDDALRIKCIGEKICELNEGYLGKRAKRVPFIPVEPSYYDLLEVLEPSREMLPIGYRRENGLVYCLETDKIRSFLVGGNNGSGKKNLMKILKASIEKTGNKVIEVKNILEIREWLKTDEDLYMFFGNMVEILDIFYTKQYDRKYENEFISAVEGNKHIKIFGVVNNEKYMLLAGRKLFEVIRRDTSGIYLGGNLDRQNLFDCSKVSFSKQCVKQPLGIGMYFGGTNGECFDIVIPKFV